MPEVNGSYSWITFSAEVEQGMTVVNEMFAAQGSPLETSAVIDHTIETTGLPRPRVVNAIAELIDDHVLVRGDDELHLVG